MGVASLNDKAATVVVALLGYLASHALAELQRNIASVEAHIAAVDAVSQANKISLAEIRTALRQRRILP